MLLGGPPFGEQIVMWWNFVGRTHDEVVAFRREWQEQITRAGAVVGDSQDVADGRFGVVLGDHLPPSRPHRSRPPASSPAADSPRWSRRRAAPVTRPVTGTGVTVCATSSTSGQSALDSGVSASVRLTPSPHARTHRR